MKKSTPEDLVLFLGAGASIPFGIPGMSQFIKLLDDAMESGAIPVGDDGKELWQRLLDIAEQENVEIDLEWILSILNDLSERNLRPAIRLFGISFEENQLEQLRSSAMELRAGIEEYVRRKCRLTSENKDIAAEYYRGFFEELLNGWGYHPKIFTTNYDNVIESSNERRNRHISPNRPKISLVSGFPASSESQDQIWDPRVFEDRIIGDSISHQLFKLHGSVDWYVGQRDNQQVILRIGAIGNGLELTDGTKLESLLIYPVEQKKVFSPPFTELFYQFRSTLIYEARVLVVIGYSFRDEMIQNLFKEALERNKSLRIFVANKSMDQIRGILSDFGDRATVIGEEFGSGEFIPSLSEKLWEETGKTIVYQAEHLPKNGSWSLVEDPEAMNGIAVELKSFSTFNGRFDFGAIYGPYRPLPESGKYRVTYRVKMIPGTPSLEPSMPIASIAVYQNDNTDKKYPRRHLKVSDFHNTYGYVCLPIELEYEDERAMEYTIQSIGNIPIQVDRISIEKHP